MRKWIPLGTSFLTPGEDNAAAPLSGGRALRIENGLLTGAGSVVCVPDWQVSATCAVGGTEDVAALYGFPFATQGGASAPSAGVAFSLDPIASFLHLHQLGEPGDILRSFNAAIYAFATPPQCTGFQMFGRAYFAADGREAVASRIGMGYFDPTGAGNVTTPSYQLAAGPAAPLRFKGISQHRGATILGWGYGDETDPDQPQMLRYCKYGDPTTWVPDGTPTSAGFINVGTPTLPIVACAASGPYSIIGKSSEVFALDGDYEDQFSLQQIGTSHGPVSTNGMTSTGRMAVWMSAQGPAYSLNGSDVQLLAHPRVLRRMGTYLDLSYVCAAHDSANTRVLFLMRRGTDLSGTGLTDAWGTQLLCWDYERDAVTVHDTPTTCFGVWTINGPGLAFGGPVGTPQSLAAAPHSTGATLTWTNVGGDPTAQISVAYRLAGSGTYTQAGPTAAGATSWTVTGLRPNTAYEWRLQYFKDGQYGAFTATEEFATTFGTSVGSPSNVTGVVTDAYFSAGKTYSTVTFSWTQGEFAPGASTVLLEHFVDDATTATIASTMAASVVSTSLTKVQAPTGYYYWVRHVLSDGTPGTNVACLDNPVVYGPL